MKIFAINNSNPESKTVSQTQSFRGLWGKTQNKFSEGYWGTDTNIVHEYYPFKDETKESIEKLVKEKSFYNSTKSNLVAEPMEHIVQISVKVMKALPFTAEDFKAFLANKVSELKKNVIESHIIEKNLKQKI